MGYTKNSYKITNNSTQWQQKQKVNCKDTTHKRTKCPQSSCKVWNKKTKWKAIKMCGKIMKSF